MDGNVGVSGLACMVIGNENGKNDAAGHDITVAGTREGLIENEMCIGGPPIHGLSRKKGDMDWNWWHRSSSAPHPLPKSSLLTESNSIKHNAMPLEWRLHPTVGPQLPDDPWDTC